MNCPVFTCLYAILCLYTMFIPCSFYLFIFFFFVHTVLDGMQHKLLFLCLPISNIVPYINPITAPNVIEYNWKCKNWSKSDYVIDTGPMHVRNCWLDSRGLAWVVKGLVCDGSRVRFWGEPPLLMVSVSNQIG